MKKLINPENPVFDFLGKLFDLMLANVLFIICSLPVITIGASLAALLQVAQDIALGRNEKTLKRYRQAFFANFKQATAAWVILLIFFIGAACDYLLVLTFAQGWANQLGKIFTGVFLFIAVSLHSYVFPLLVRYKNTLSQHYRNAVVLSVVKLPKTLVMFLLNTLLFWIVYFSVKIFISSLVFWLIIGFSFIAYLDSLLLASVFQKLESE